MSQSEYVLANVSPQTKDRFSGREAVCDPVTFRHLESVGITEGWSCLEVGAGGGSVARWMGERVGRTGHVLVTDLDTRWVNAAGANLDVRQLDLRRDPVPERAFDLVHARLVLQHLPERDAVLRRLVAALKPGGWIVVSEFDNHYDGCPNPADEREALVNRGARCLYCVAHGGGQRRSVRPPAASAVRGGGAPRRARRRLSGGGRRRSPGSGLMLANVRQMRPRLVEAFGLTDLELTRYEAALEDPAFSWLMPVLFTACGRRPADD
jgi:SAM-dependent methyltransferase